MKFFREPDCEILGNERRSVSYYKVADMRILLTGKNGAKLALGNSRAGPRSLWARITALLSREQLDLNDVSQVRARIHELHGLQLIVNAAAYLAGSTAPKQEPEIAMKINATAPAAMAEAARNKLGPCSSITQQIM